MAEADGQEVLVVDTDERVQRGMTQMLADNGLVPTVVSDPVRARELAGDKYFAVALIDLDTPQPNGGLELVRWFKAHAPTTTTIMMASRKVYESAVEAFRAGAADIIVKSPDQVQYLRQRTVELAAGVQKTVTDDRLMQEVIGVHEDFLRRLMDSSRRTAELEEQIGGGSHPSIGDDEACALLVVEEDGWLAQQLGEALEARGGYMFVSARTGGEAIDRAGGHAFQIALVRDTLPDLTGTMVVSALKAQSQETLTILYSRPGAQPGKADVIEGSKVIPLVPEFSQAQQMVERVDELREAFRRKSRERRYLAAFRQENYELLRRYADLKIRLQRAAQK